MGRPLKKGLRYFPLDSDLFENRKVKRLVRIYGSDGIAIYITVVCDIYRVNGYYVSDDDDYCEDVGLTLNLPQERVRKILTYCCEAGLFDEGLWLSKKVYTSLWIQDRYRDICKRSRNCIRQDLLILPKTDEIAAESAVSVSEIPVFATETSTNRKKKEKELKEEEKKTSSLSSLSVSSEVEVFAGELEKYFNATFGNRLPYLTRLTPQRMSAIGLLEKEFGRDVIFRMFENLQESPFLLGENERCWRVDFDWLLRPENFIKVLEGKFIKQTKEKTIHEKIDGNARGASASERAAELQRMAADAIRRDLDKGTVR